MSKKLLTSILFLLLTFSTINGTYATANDVYGAKGALKDNDLSLIKALTYSLEDEFLAQANYDIYIEEFGPIRPFVQNKVSEKHHIKKLLTLFKKYNINVPKDIGKKFTTKPNSLDHAFSEGIKKEKENISMYTKLQSIKVFPEDVLTIFQELKMESTIHLDNLEKR